MTIMKQLTKKQLETICGGNNMTWRADYAAMLANSGRSGSNSGPASSPGTAAGSNIINIFGNGNAAIIVVQNNVLVNSVLAIDILQGS